MLNGGMTPWDYYSQGTQIADRDQEVTARMQQMRNQQIMQKMQMDRLNQMMPMQMRLSEARAEAAQALASSRDPNSPMNQALTGMRNANTGRATAQAARANAQADQLKNGTGPISPNSPQAIQNKAQTLDYTNALAEHMLQERMLPKAIDEAQGKFVGNQVPLKTAHNIWTVDKTGKAIPETDPNVAAIGYSNSDGGGLDGQIPMTNPGDALEPLTNFRQLQTAKQSLANLKRPVWQGSANTDGARAQAAIDRLNASNLKPDEKAAAIAKIHAQLQGAVAPSAPQAPAAGLPGDAGSLGDEGEPGEDDTQDTEQPEEMDDEDEPQ